jgi:hypothetical protein
VTPDNILPLVAACIYLTNRFVMRLDFVVSPDFAANHLGDLCGGIIFPAYVNTLARVVTMRPLITTLGRTLALMAVCALCWELLAPVVITHSTPDPLDACMYVLGGLMYLLAFKAAAARTTNVRPS